MGYGVHAVVTDCERDHVIWNTKPNLEHETKNKLHPLYQHDECILCGKMNLGTNIWTIGFDSADNYAFVDGEVTTSGQSNDVKKNILYLFSQKLAKDSSVVYRSVRKLIANQ